MWQRRGFTLVELLIVIGVIATLAAMTVPAIGFAKRMVKDVQCGHNLQQIGVAIEVFKGDHDDQFPYYLTIQENDPNGVPRTTLTRRKDELLADMTGIFKCPRDSLVGTPWEDPHMGRKPPGPPANWGDVSFLREPGCSYLYQASGRVITNPDFTNWFLKGIAANDPRRSASLTWAQAKTIQLKTGNYVDATNNARGAPFNADHFPIIQCFHHFDWDKATPQQCITVKKVKCVSWNLSVFDATSSWEGDVDSRFYLPNPP